MSWETLLNMTRILAGIVEPLIEGIASIVSEWNEAPEEAAAQRAEALALLAGLQNSLSGALDRADTRDLEAD